MEKSPHDAARCDTEKGSDHAAPKSGLESADRGSMERGSNDHEVRAPSLEPQADANEDLVDPHATL